MRSAAIKEFSLMITDPAVGQQFSPAEKAESRPKEELDAKPSLDFLESKLHLSLNLYPKRRGGEVNGINISIGS